MAKREDHLTSNGLALGREEGAVEGEQLNPLATVEPGCQ